MNASIIRIAALAAAATALGAGAQPAGNLLNPAISLILDARFSRFEQDPDAYALPGFQLGAETGPGEQGFALGEAELVISANVDDWFSANLVAAIADEGGEGAIELEEAWIQTLALPAGFKLKAGKMFSRIGYQNEKHPHAQDFADVPLLYRAFFAANLKDTGLQLRWVAPTDLYLELGAEALRGDGFPAAGAADDGTGTTTLFAKLGGDVGASHSWQLGLSRVDAQAVDRTDEPVDPAAPPPLAFTGDSTITGVDFVWKWAPAGNYKQRNLALSAEWMRRDEQGTLATDFGGGPEAGTYDGEQTGWYAQGVYQFMPQWRVGLRFDALASDNQVAGLSQPTVLDDGGHDPKRSSLMVDYSHSEFSRIRLQFNDDRSGPASDAQVILQYIVSIGPHGAHQY